TVHAVAAMNDRVSAAANPRIGAANRYPPSQATSERNGHSPSRPTELSSVRSTILTPSSVDSDTGSVTSHSRSQSGCTNSRLASDISNVAISRINTSNVQPCNTPVASV